MSSVGDLRFAHSARLTLLILQLRIRRGGGGAKGPQEQLVYTGENGALSSAALNIQTASWRLCCVKGWGVGGECFVVTKNISGRSESQEWKKDSCFLFVQLRHLVDFSQRAEMLGGKNDEKIRVSVLRWTLGSGGRRHPV